MTLRLFVSPPCPLLVSKGIIVGCVAESRAVKVLSSGGTGPQSFEAKRPVLLVLFGPFTKPYLDDKAAFYLNFLPYISPCCMVMVFLF